MATINRNYERNLTLPTQQTGLTVATETITPDTACVYLERNNGNRHVRQDHVARLARDMVTGNWRLNGEPISFDREGNLINGQHRLWACVMSKVSFETVVVRGVDSQAYTTIDIGRPKSMGDFLLRDHVKNANVVAAIVRLVLYHERNQLSMQKNGNLTPTIAEVQDGLLRHPGVVESAAWASTDVKNILRSSLAGFMHYLMSTRYPDTWRLFTGQLVHGVGLTMDDPVYQLRKHLLRQRGRRDLKLDPVYAMAITIKAFNALLEGRSVQVLAWKPNEKFPEPLLAHGDRKSAVA